uniref:Lipoprotein n=1 Tax=Nitratidesulfovibrio vulgaris (strain DSM 19637 / Miyazaki F) TaxID=883 RepID=B8DPX1_NITV9
MPIRHSVLAALFFTVLALPALPAFATGGGKRYEQVGEHYDVSINYPVLQHPAADADIVRIVWKLTDAFRRVAGHGLPQQSAAAPNPRQDDGTAGADRPGSTDTPDSTNTPGSTGARNPPHGVVPDGAAQGAPRADADVYTPARRDWLTATHRISRPSANAVSVVFEVQTGLWGRDGAAVSLDLLAVSYDLAAGRRIELDDLFGDDDCADAVLTTHLRRRNGGGASDR